MYLMLNHNNLLYSTLHIKKLNVCKNSWECRAKNLAEQHFIDGSTDMIPFHNISWEKF